jgi:hypothetical protein
MTRHLRLPLTILAVAVLLAAGAAAQKNTSASAMLRAAADKAAVDGDLNGAVKQYQAIVDQFGKTDRAAAATALVRMAECYQKLGDAQAQKIYERVVRDYSDQNEAAVLARARLGRGGESVARARGDRAVWTGSKVDLFGRVSPDGRYVTYVDWLLNGNLAVHDVAANIDHLLTPKKTWEDAEGGQASWSAISPDGKQIAYGWQSTDPDIRIAALDPTATPEPRRVVKFSANDVRFVGVRDWSPDGKSLAIGLSRKDGTSQIGIAAVADGAFRVLKSTDWRGADRIMFSRDSSMWPTTCRRPTLPISAMSSSWRWMAAVRFPPWSTPQTTSSWSGCRMQTLVVQQRPHGIERAVGRERGRW